MPKTMIKLTAPGLALTAGPAAAKDDFYPSTGG